MTDTAGQLSQDEGVQTVSFVSLGCPKNLVDSEKMLGLLAEDGILPIPHVDGGGFDADAVVINTCGFLEASKQESLGVIEEAIEAKLRGDVRRVVVAGCLVQRHRAKLLEWAPGIDAMVGVFDRDRIVKAVRGGRPEREVPGRGGDAPAYWIAGNALTAAQDRGRNVVGLTVSGADGKGVGYYEDDSARLRLTPRHSAFLRISEGCNQNCAFCTIPSIRGKMRSKPIEKVVAEARELIHDGTFELNLIGQDTTSYGDDLGTGWDEESSSGGLPALLTALNDVVEREGGGGLGGWIRLMYAYPSTFGEAMIEAIAELPHVVKYIDIPLQHASDSMLERMRRRVLARQQEELIERLRDRVPGIAIRTTLITGFPGESVNDHEELLSFVERMKFEALGVFEYSHEEGTPAGRMDSDPALHVPDEVKARRHAEIMGLQQRIAFDRAKQRASGFDQSASADIWPRTTVLIDAQASAEDREQVGIATAIHDGLLTYVGRTTWQAPGVDSVCYLRTKERISPGELIRCVVVDSDGYDLVVRPEHDLIRSTRLPVIGG